MHTPRGTLELKYFSSHVGTDGGGEASSTAIKEHIKELINHENPKKPLSDNKLSQMLSERGFKSPDVPSLNIAKCLVSWIKRT